MRIGAIYKGESMKRFFAVLLCLALVGGILGAVLAGCGSSKAQTVINQARDSITQAQTFRFKGTKELAASTTGQSDETSQTFALAGDSQTVGDVTNQHLVLDTGQGIAAEYYIMGDKAYINLGTSTWYYDDTGGQIDQPGNTEGFSKKDIDEMLKAAEGAKITSEEGSVTTVTLNVGQAYMNIIGQQLKDAAAKGGMSEDDLNSSLELLKNMKINLTLVYDSSANQIQHIERNMDISTGSAVVSIRDKLDFYDYGAAIQITLPAAAQNAEPWSAYLQLLQQQTGQ